MSAKRPLQERIGQLEGELAEMRRLMPNWRGYMLELNILRDVLAAKLETAGAMQELLGDAVLRGARSRWRLRRGMAREVLSAPDRDVAIRSAVQGFRQARRASAEAAGLILPPEAEELGAEPSPEELADATRAVDGAILIWLEPRAPGDLGRVLAPPPPEAPAPRVEPAPAPAPGLGGDSPWPGGARIGVVVGEAILPNEACVVAGGFLKRLRAADRYQPLGYAAESLAIGDVAEVDRDGRIRRRRPPPARLAARLPGELPAAAEELLAAREAERQEWARGAAEGELAAAMSDARHGGAEEPGAGDE